MRSRNLFPREFNRVEKPRGKRRISVALCYPNSYRAGMANVAVHLLYDALNQHQQILCERVFLGDLSQPQRSVESGHQLNAFDVIAVSFQYETDYPNFLQMLHTSNIPISARERGGSPFIIAGGPCVLENPAPLHPFIDLFVIGEVEPLLKELSEVISNTNRSEFALTLAKPRNRGWYIPHVTGPVYRSVVQDLDLVPYPVNQVIPDVEPKSQWSPAFGRAFLLEATRGCGHACRFCLIGHTQNPVRFRSVSKLLELAVEGTRGAATSNIALIGSSLTDHPKLVDLGHELLDREFTFSMSSLRLDKINEEIVDVLRRTNQKTITFAPEAGTERLRKDIHKAISDEEVISACEIALQGGIQKIKLYFILGLPNETPQDVEAIITLVKQILKLSPKPKVDLSINPFIPKPHTPLQDAPMLAIAEYRKRLKTIKKALNKLVFGNVAGLDPRWARIQTLLSIGNEEISEILKQSSLLGGTLGAWRRALKDHNTTIEEHVEKPRDPKQKRPWDHISV